MCSRGFIFEIQEMYRVECHCKWSKTRDHIKYIRYAAMKNYMRMNDESSVSRPLLVAIVLLCLMVLCR